MVMIFEQYFIYTLLQQIQQNIVIKFQVCVSHHPQKVMDYQSHVP